MRNKYSHSYDYGRDYSLFLFIAGKGIWIEIAVRTTPFVEGHVLELFCSRSVLSLSTYSLWSFREISTYVVTKFENRNSCHTLPLTHILNNISVSETAIY